MDLFTTFIRLAEEEIPQDRIIDGWDLRQDLGIVSKEKNGYLEWIQWVSYHHFISNAVYIGLHFCLILNTKRYFPTDLQC